MAVSYNVVFEIEEASHWLSFDDCDDEFKSQTTYEMHREDVEGKQVYYIINEKGVKNYDAWKNRRGDFITYC